MPWRNHCNISVLTQDYGFEALEAVNISRNIWIYSKRVKKVVGTKHKSYTKVQSWSLIQKKWDPFLKFISVCGDDADAAQQRRRRRAGAAAGEGEGHLASSTRAATALSPRWTLVRDARSRASSLRYAAGLRRAVTRHVWRDRRLTACNPCSVNTGFCATSACDYDMLIRVV